MKKQYFKATLKPKTLYVKAESEKEANSLIYSKLHNNLGTLASYAKPSKSEQQEKDLESRKAQVRNTLSPSLLSFKNHFVNQYVNYLLKDEELKLKAIKEHHALLLKKGEKITGNMEYHLEKQETKVRYSDLLKINFYAEANQAYEERFDKLCATLIEKGVAEKGLLKVLFAKVETMRDFSFLVVNEYTGAEVHARVIFACGEINAPHYRFIITKRN